MATPEAREQRAARNELVFRMVNEQIVDISERFASLLSDIDVVCECTDGSCVGTIRLQPGKFAELRQTEGDFIVLPGHEQLDVEGVVERHERYLVVHKDPAAVKNALHRA